ncbi:MAG: family transcriptional regulator, cyclic receptor protein, partial [Patescibacteria group bacterium]|nr:family transcriptional regulator, cyclic receptor protein [Patescibacteria group bacterium]
MNKEHMAFVNLLLIDSSESRKKIFRSIKARSAAKRTKIEKIADWMTSFFGGINFLITNLIVFVAWIFINTGQVASITAFDPFPFNLLTMIVSLEAIILSVFVLISQNRSSKVGELREETH